ncbi:MAG: glycosyltransferase [Bacteroidetes bacterium]|nr:MAG: glycosyltransferase [Bacteroidota bacterium]
MPSSAKKYSKKKLVVCLSRFPYPIEKGDKLRAFYQIRDLSAYFDIYLLCTSEHEIKTEFYQKLSSYCKQIHIFRLHPLVKWWKLFTGLFGRKPFQVLYFSQGQIQRKIGYLLEEIKPDHIYCQLIRSAEYVKHYHNCPKTLDLMDALSKGMERRIDQAGWFFKPLVREESNRLLNYERKILNYFEYATIISEQDKQFIYHPNKEEIEVIPNGVDDSFFEVPAKIEQKEYDLVFVGNMSYEPNVEAAEILVKEVLPILKKKNPGISLLISGVNPSKIVQALASDSVHIGGWVDDIRTSYRSARVFVAPMRIGSGMQNKLLEAMALGLPCVTSSLANNAILAESEEEILLADDSEETVKQIERLLQNEELSAKIAKKGNHFVRKRYNWKEINRGLAKMMNPEIE